MATYTETITLDDQVSGKAANASNAINTLRRAMNGLAKLGAPVAALGASLGAIVAPLTSLTGIVNALADAFARLAGVSNVKIPKLAAAPGAAAPAARAAPTLASPVAASAPTPAAAGVPPVKVPLVVPDTVSAVAQFKSLTSAVKAGESAMTKAAALGDTKGFDAAKAKVVDLKGAISSLPEGTEKAAGGTRSFEKALWSARNAMDVGRQTITAAVQGIASSFSALAKGDVRGAIQGMTDAVAGMAKMLDMVVPGLGQVASAVISIGGGIAAALGGGIASAVKFAVSINQAERSAIASFDALGAASGTTGQQVKDMLDGLSDKIGIADDVLEPLTKDFMKMGVVGVDALEKLTLAAISANAIVGSDAGAAAFTTLQKKIQLAAETGQKFQLGTKALLQLGEAGTSVTDIAAKMGMSTKALTDGLAAGTVDAKAFGEAMTDAVIGKGSGPLAAMGAEWGHISKMFSKSIGDMFKGLDIGPLMSAVKDFFAIFQQASPSGQAMKSGVGGAMQTILDIAAKVVPMVKHLFLDIEIYALKAYIAVKPIVDRLLAMTGASSVVDLVTGAFATLGGWLQKAADLVTPLIKRIGDFLASESGMKILSAVFSALWTALKVVGVAIAVVVAVFVGLWAICVGFGVTMWALIGTVLAFGSSIGEGISKGIQAAKFYILTFITDVLVNFYALRDKMYEMGGNLLQGLIDGIMSKVDLVKNTISGVAGGILDVFGAKTETHSPSRAFARAGGFLGDGLVVGMEASAPDVYGASSSLGGMAVAGASESASAPAAASSDGGTSGGAGAAGGGKAGGCVIESIVVNIDGASKDVQQVGQEVLAGLFEQFALQAGL